MSETPHNDSERDAGLSAIYRAAAADAPPPALDAAILAAARREVGARPRPAGFAFSSSWRTSLSIAAVLVLSVSLVTLMREEAPELVAPPRADMPAAESELKSPGMAQDMAGPAGSGVMREEQRSKNIGLKPPQSAAPSGLGMRAPEIAQAFPKSKKDAAGKLEADAVAPADLAKRRVETPAVADARENRMAAAEPQRQAPRPDAQRNFAQAPGASSGMEAGRSTASAQANAPAPATMAGSIAGMAENKAQVKTDPDRSARTEAESRMRSQEYAPSKQVVEAPPAEAAAGRPSPPAAVVMAKPAPVTPAATVEAPPPPAIAAAPKPAPSPPRMIAQPKAKPATPPVAVSKLERTLDLPPEKWLERIEELRKQGRFDEAKASLAEFRKRYPDYRLPDTLKDWAKP